MPHVVEVVFQIIVRVDEDCRSEKLVFPMHGNETVVPLHNEDIVGTMNNNSSAQLRLRPDTEPAQTIVCSMGAQVRVRFDRTVRELRVQPLAVMAYLICLIYLIDLTHLYDLNRIGHKP